MSIAEWHKSKMENPVYESGYCQVILYNLFLMPFLWAFCLGWGSVFYITEVLRANYGPDVGNKGILSSLILIPAAAVLCFKVFFMIFRKSSKIALRLATVTTISFLTAVVWLVSR